MRKIGLSPIYQAPKTSEPHPQHKVYPYLLRRLAIERPNQVWCADVTYIPMRRGFLYLVAIMDWASRKVLAWRLSNTMEADFCVAALEEAIARYGRPDIFNTDQGSQGGIQTVVATRIVLIHRSHSSSASAGVFQPSVFRGLALRAAATAAISSALWMLRSVPFGKY